MKRFVSRKAIVTTLAVSILVAASRPEVSSGNHPAAASIGTDHQEEVVGRGSSFWRAVRCGTCVAFSLTSPLPIPIAFCAKRACRA